MGGRVSSAGWCGIMAPVDRDEALELARAYIARLRGHSHATWTIDYTDPQLWHAIIEVGSLDPHLIGIEVFDHIMRNGANVPYPEADYFQ